MFNKESLKGYLNKLEMGKQGTAFTGKSPAINAIIAGFVGIILVLAFMPVLLPLFVDYLNQTYQALLPYSTLAEIINPNNGIVMLVLVVAVVGIVFAFLGYSISKKGK